VNRTVELDGVVHLAKRTASSTNGLTCCGRLAWARMTDNEIHLMAMTDRDWPSEGRRPWKGFGFDDPTCVECLSCT